MSKEKIIPQHVADLANVFMGGRISGWVGRNRSQVSELELLDKLSPGFAEATKGLRPEEKILAITQALAIADGSPLSATNYEPISADSCILRRKRN